MRDYNIKFTGEIIGKYGKVLKPARDKDGYLMVHFYHDGVVKTHKVHRLIAKEFISNPKNYEEVNHIDEDKTNNHVSNLEWCTRAMNKQHSSKLDWSKIEAIRSSTLKQKHLAEIYGVSKQNISNIKANKIWISNKR